MRNPTANRSAATTIEILETRIAPALFLNPHLVSYTDEDGDIVRVHISKPVFSSDFAGFTFAPSGAGETLEALALPPAAAHASLHIFVRFPAADGGGDGKVNVGLITAPVALDAVRVEGDLTAIDVGRVGAALHGRSGDGLGLLSVKSMGVQYAGEEQLSGPAPVSEISGGLGRLAVAGNLMEENLEILDSGAVGSLGSGTIRGSMIGGSIVVNGKIGNLTVDGDLQGEASDNTGLISAKTGIGSVTIHGSVVGGSGESSGCIENSVSGGLARLLVGGRIAGGHGKDSGAIDITGTIGSAVVSGSILGGDGEGSGRIAASHSLGRLRLLGNLIGGSAAPASFEQNFEGSGVIFSAHRIHSAQISGSIEGGSGQTSGALIAYGRIDRASVKGDVDGGEASFSGIFGVRGFGRVTVAGSVIGGTGSSSGDISPFSAGPSSLLPVGVIEVRGDVVGGAGSASGEIGGAGQVNSLRVGGSVIGGSGDGSGSLFARILGKAHVGGNIVGGSGDGSGTINSVSAGSIDIGGSVQGGLGSLSGYLGLDGRVGSIGIHGNLAGGGGGDSGMVQANFVQRIRIGGSLEGGDGLDSGLLEGNRFGTLRIGGDITGVRTDYNEPFGGTIFNGAVMADRIGVLRIDGLISASDTDNEEPITSYAVLVAGHIHRMSIGGGIQGTEMNRIGISTGYLSLHGDSFPADDDLHSRAGIDSLTIGGSVISTEITAGYVDPEMLYGNPEAHIGRLTVKGSWIASSVAAGLTPGPDGEFGTQDDTVAVLSGGPLRHTDLSRIGAIIIRGTVEGTTASGDSFGFEAQRIGAVSIDGRAIPLPHSGAELQLASDTDDVWLREL